MNEIWRTTLDDAGAVWDAAGGVLHYGNPTREARVVTTGAVMTDLSQRSYITAHGPDAEKFLQGQLTNDISAVTAERAQLSAYCSPKGRVLALLHILRRNEDYLLWLPAALREPTHTRLRKFILMSKVTLDASDDLIAMGYAHPRDDQALRALVGDLPGQAHDVARLGDYTVVRLPGTQPRFEIIGSPPALQDLWHKLNVNAAPVGPGPWELLDILGGIPEVYPETVDAFVPQMLNLDLLDGINLKKGCYTGQEVVARMHYLGKLKRRMVRLSCATDHLPPPGAPLYSPAHRPDESVGTVIRAQPSPDEQAALLAVIQSDMMSQELRLNGIDGPVCLIQPLPYALDPAARRK